MKENIVKEIWLKGPVKNVPVLLQPFAHALLQAREEVKGIMYDFDEKKLWLKPADVACVAFHLQHLSGVLDRLFTYVKGKQLSPEQLEKLNSEGKFDKKIHSKILIEKFNLQVDKAIDQLINTNEETLKEPRGVGRKQLPSTVIGLLFHAAEHTMRHVGQLSVTVKVLS
jgi:hypothetical protein